MWESTLSSTFILFYTLEHDFVQLYEVPQILSFLLTENNIKHSNQTERFILTTNQNVQDFLSPDESLCSTLQLK